MFNSKGKCKVAPVWLLYVDGRLVGTLLAWCKFTVEQYLRENKLDTGIGYLYNARKRAEERHVVFRPVI